jgi:hypothetical protein
MVYFFEGHFAHRIYQKGHIEKIGYVQVGDSKIKNGRYYFDLICLYNHLMIYKYSFSSILTGVPVCSVIFSHLVIQYTVLDLVN